LHSLVDSARSARTAPVEAGGQPAKHAAVELWQVPARISCVPEVVLSLSPYTFSARSADSFLPIRLPCRISRGSGSPNSGARRSRSRTGVPTGTTTGASRRGPPIWRSTSSSSSRCVLPPRGSVVILFGVPMQHACMLLFGCSLVLIH
jgi:hypothetical protein